MTETLPDDLALAIRQRVMHRTSGCEALAYQYGWDMGTAEARYDADTAALELVGALPDLPPSPNVSGTDAVHVEPDVVAEAHLELEPEPAPEPPPFEAAPDEAEEQADE